MRDIQSPFCATTGLNHVIYIIANVSPESKMRFLLYQLNGSITCI